MSSKRRLTHRFPSAPCTEEERDLLEMQSREDGESMAEYIRGAVRMRFMDEIGGDFWGEDEGEGEVDVEGAA